MMTNTPIRRGLSVNGRRRGRTGPPGGCSGSIRAGDSCSDSSVTALSDECEVRAARRVVAAPGPQHETAVRRRPRAHAHVVLAVGFEALAVRELDALELGRPLL